MLNVLRVQKLYASAVIPQKAHPSDAGYDLSSVHDVVIESGDWKLVSTGLALTVPLGSYGRIAPRSSLATKGLNVGAGVIDRGYRGEVKVMLFNHGKTDYVIKTGDRIAQLILEKFVANCLIEQVEVLADSVRGAGGFGSSGV